MIYNGQVGLELRKTIGDKGMNIARSLERALHLEALVRIEEEEQTPRIAAIRRDKTEMLINAVNRLDHYVSVSIKNKVRSSDGWKDNSHRGGTRRDMNRYREQVSRDRARTTTPAPNTRERNDDPRRCNNYDKYRLCGKKVIGQRLP